VHSYWAWKTVPDCAEPSPPDEVRVAVERVKVVVSGLVQLPSGKVADPSAPESYQFVVTMDQADFPSAVLQPGETVVEAVGRALEQVGLVTWPPFVEPLYSALTPRGRLAKVVLVTAFACTRPRTSWSWKPWPPWKIDSPMANLYEALRDVWVLRIWKHLAREPRTAGITTMLRDAASKYIKIQQDLRAGVSGVDTSLVEYLRRGMSDDEKLIERLLREHEELGVELDQQKETDREMAAEAQASSAEIGSPGESGGDEADDDSVPEGEGGEEDFDPSEDAG
jgi:hypothetical protein